MANILPAISPVYSAYAVTAQKTASMPVSIAVAPVYEYDWGKQKMVRCNEAFASFLGMTMEEAEAD